MALGWRATHGYGYTTTSEGVHIAFAAAKRSIVDEFYRAALAAGGQDNGAPGVRTHYHDNYYAAYVLDPDGVNVEVVCQQLN